MAMQLRFGTLEERNIIGKTIETLDFDTLENILEESRGIMFDNTGDDKIIVATNHLVDFIQVNLAIMAMTTSRRNAH